MTDRRRKLSSGEKKKDSLGKVVSPLPVSHKNLRSSSAFF